jgi:cold-inducible RNA-binding protein
MPSKLYVGNLAYAVSNDDLQQLFSQVGQVQSVAIITDKFSGQSKGFGFVEMASAEDAAKAIQQFNETELKGRNIKVNEAKPRESSFGGGGGGNRGGGGGGGGNRGRDRWEQSIEAGAGRAPPPLYLSVGKSFEPDCAGRCCEPIASAFQGRPVGKTSQRTASPAEATGQGTATRKTRRRTADSNRSGQGQGCRPCRYDSRTAARPDYRFRSVVRLAREALCRSPLTHFSLTAVFVRCDSQTARRGTVVSGGVARRGCRDLPSCPEFPAWLELAAGFFD